MDCSNSKRHMLNPNYASVRCMQPLPSVIELRKREDLKRSEGDVSPDDETQSNTTERPLLLTNNTYEEHYLQESVGQTTENYNSNNQTDVSVEAEPPTTELEPRSAKLGIFQFMKFVADDDDDDEDDDTDHHAKLTRKEKMKHVLHSKPIHILIIILVIVDSILVIVELLFDLNVIYHDATNPLRNIFHGFSIAILATFMIEISLKIYADYEHFINHKIEVVDAIVVVVSFVIDVALVFIPNREVLAALGFLVVFRLWRVVRIVNGIIVAVKTEADDRVHAFKDENKKLEMALMKAKEKIKLQSIRIKKLKETLKEHGIDVEDSPKPPKLPEG